MNSRLNTEDLEDLAFYSFSEPHIIYSRTVVSAKAPSAMLLVRSTQEKCVDVERANEADDICSFLHNVLVHDLVLLVGPRLERLMRRDHTVKVPSKYIQGRDSKPSVG